MRKMKIIPVKFIFVLSIICLIMFPIFLYLLPLTIFYLLTLGNSIVPYYVIFIGIAFGGIIEIWFILFPEYCKLIIKNGTVSNYIYDGTDNDGWRESISNIKRIEIVGKEDVQKYYRQFNKSKAILIDFGGGYVKYIYAGWFSKRQIKKIMKLLNNKQDTNRN